MQDNRTTGGRCHSARKGIGMYRDRNGRDGIAILPQVEGKSGQSASRVVMNRKMYPLYVGGSAAEGFRDSAEKGSSFLLSVKVYSETYSASDLMWKIDDNSIVDFDDRDCGGYVSLNPEECAPETESRETCAATAVSRRVRALRTGITAVRASLPDGSFAECIFTVIDFFTRLTAADVELNTGELYLKAGEAARLFPILYPKDIFGNGRLETAVVWHSCDVNVAKVERGIVTAVADGETDIVVCTADVERQAICHVVVGPKAGSDKAADGGIPDTDSYGFPAPQMIGVGERLELRLPAGAGKRICWVSENRYVADVDKDGIVTGLSASLAQRVDASGLEVMEIPEPVWIYATDMLGGRTVKYSLYVRPAGVPVMGMSVSPENTVLSAGSSRILTAAVSPSAPREETVLWESSDETVLKIYPVKDSVSGTAQARIIAVRCGAAVVTARFGGIAEAVCHVRVMREGKKLEAFSLDDREISVDQVYRFAPALSEEAQNRKLYWVTSDYETATMDREGNVQGYRPGVCQIYAIADDSLTEEQKAWLKTLGTNTKNPEKDEKFREILSDAVYGVCELRVKEESVCLRNLHVVEESVTDHSVLLLWNRASLLDAKELREYDIYQNGNRIGTTAKLGYRAESLNPEQEYHFAVEAIGNKGEILAYAETAVTTKPLSAIRSVLEYGAVGDGRRLETIFIQKAIDDCPKGGTVLLPAGHIFISGALFLKSDMTFRVDGILMGSIDPKDYPRVISRWEGWRKLNCPAAVWDNTSAKVPDSHCPHASLLNAGCYDEGLPGTTGPYHVENLVICGNGQINANGFTLAYNEGPNINIGKFVGIDTYPVQDASLRGSVLRIHNGRNIYVKEVQIAYAPFWTVHTIYCDRITFDGLEVVSMGDGDGGKGSDLFYCGHVFNGDGIDPEHCTNVNIFDVWFTTGDDPVAIKSGRNREGNELDKPNAYIRVTDCVSRWSLGGFGIGSESASGSHDLIFQNLDIRDIVLNGIWIKTCRPRGGVTEFIQVRDVTARNCDCPVWIFNNYSSTSVHANPAADPPVVRRMVFENVRGSADNKRGFVVDGVEDCPVSDVHFRGADNGGRPNVIRYGENVTGLDTENEKVRETN